MYCRFENRSSQQALVFQHPVERHAAYRAQDVDAVFAAIDAANAKGLWVSLVLNYELGAVLLGLDTLTPTTAPLITAMMFRGPTHSTPWQAPNEAVHLNCRMQHTLADYKKDIDHIRQQIREGEYYQINHTVSIDVHSAHPPEQVYRHIASQHPSSHAAYIVDGKRHIASFSPELFVKRQGTTLTVRPMKGTRPRFADPHEDYASGQALRNSPKDCAENIMIVDLLRNDLGQIAVPGSVQVSALLELEQYPSVWTMTSTVQAQQQPQTSLKSLLTALFPCGSITGAPKRAAMHAIHELEQRQRGIYCGSLGWLAPNGDLNLNVAIRTLEFDGTQLGRFGVGGGIVYDSDAEQEWQECLWKARILGTDIQLP